MVPNQRSRSLSKTKQRLGLTTYSLLHTVRCASFGLVIETRGMPPPMWHIGPHFVRVPLKGGNPVLSIQREREREMPHWSQAERLCVCVTLCASVLYVFSDWDKDRERESEVWSSLIGSFVCLYFEISRTIMVVGSVCEDKKSPCLVIFFYWLTIFDWDYLQVFLSFSLF